MLLSKKNLQFVSQFADHKQLHLKLHGVSITEKNMVATDGHMLAKVTIPDHNMKDFPAVGGLQEDQPKFQPCLVPAEFLQSVAKSIKHRKIYPILNHAAIDTAASQKQQIEIVTTDLENTQRHVSKKIEGKCVDYKKAIPTDIVYSITVDPAYLMKIAKAFHDYGEKAITLEFQKTALQSIKISGDTPDSPETLLAPLEGKGNGLH